MRGIFAVLIIAVCFALAVIASQTLGDPSAPAPEIKGPVLMWDPGLEPADLRATADSARVTADAMQARQVERTQVAQAATAEVYLEITRQAAEDERVMTVRAENTRQAERLMIAGWTATADSVRATSTASGMATASAVAATQTLRVADLEFQRKAAETTATVAALVAEQEKADLDIRGRALMNDAWAVTKWVLLVSFIALLAYLAYRFVWSLTQIRVIQPAANGDKPMIYKNGVVLDMDRSPSAVVDMASPPQVPLDQQLQIASGDQRVDATRALPRTIINQPLAAPAAPLGFSVLNENQAPPSHLLPDPDVTGVIDGDWSNQ